MRDFFIAEILSTKKIVILYLVWFLTDLEVNFAKLPIIMFNGIPTSQSYPIIMFKHIPTLQSYPVITFNHIPTLQSYPIIMLNHIAILQSYPAWKN